MKTTTTNNCSKQLVDVFLFIQHEIKQTIHVTHCLQRPHLLVFWPPILPPASPDHLTGWRVQTADYGPPWLPLLPQCPCTAVGSPGSIDCNWTAVTCVNGQNSGTIHPSFTSMAAVWGKNRTTSYMQTHIHVFVLNQTSVSHHQTINNQQKLPGITSDEHKHSTVYMYFIGI